MTDEQFEEFLDQLKDNDGSESDDLDDQEVSEYKLSDSQLEKLKSEIEKQTDFLDGQTNKEIISDEDETTLGTIDESGTNVKTVASELQDSNYKISKGLQVIVVDNMTESLMNTRDFPLTQHGATYETEINQGISLGKRLGKKLKLRTEERNTVFNRQKTGRIDKRMISTLGFGNENVFTFTETDSYKKANVHISIDASGSMDGRKWKSTLVNAVALCKAIDMIPSLEIQVSIRTTSGRYGSRNHTPYIVMAYDSRVDKFSKVKKLFPRLDCDGTTPEGLLFESIMDKFIPSGNDMDSYFINISDGEPWFDNQKDMNYGGQVAVKHTRQQIKKMESRGIKVNSYFVSEGGNSSETDFRNSYGSGNSKFIDVTNLNEVTKTINQLFMKK